MIRRPQPPFSINNNLKSVAHSSINPSSPAPFVTSANPLAGIYLCLLKDLNTLRYSTVAQDECLGSLFC